MQLVSYIDRQTDLFLNIHRIKKLMSLVFKDRKGDGQKHKKIDIH